MNHEQRVTDLRNLIEGSIQGWADGELGRLIAVLAIHTPTRIYPSHPTRTELCCTVCCDNDPLNYGYDPAGPMEWPCPTARACGVDE